MDQQATQPSQSPVVAEFVRGFRLLSPDRLATLLGYSKAQQAEGLHPEMAEATQIIITALEQVKAERETTNGK